MYRPLTKAITIWDHALHHACCMARPALAFLMLCMQGLTWGLHHAAAGHGHAGHHAHARSGRTAHAHAHAVLTQGVRPQRGAHRLGLYREYALPALPPHLRQAWQDASETALHNPLISGSGLHGQIGIADLAQEEKLQCVVSSSLHLLLAIGLVRRLALACCSRCPHPGNP